MVEAMNHICFVKVLKERPETNQVALREDAPDG